MDHPIACTLSAADFAARTRDVKDLARRALRSRHEIPEGMRLVFEPGAENERAVRELVAAEARCCAFLRMELRPGEEALVLDVTGPLETEPIIAEVFA